MIEAIKKYIWRYIDRTPEDQRKRILALDLMRGLFMVCIIIDHNAGWSPSFFSIFTGQGTLFMSAAEGFFAISGILVGYIYGPKILKNPRTTWTKLLKRSLSLYLLTIAFTVLFSAWAIITPSVDYHLTKWSGDIVGFILQTVTLQFAYGWNDFLRQYAVFMLFAPIAVFLCARKKWYVVFALSFLVWLILGQNGALQPFSTWQVIFIPSIIIGYYLPQIERTFKNINHATRGYLAPLFIFTAFITYLISVLFMTAIPDIYIAFGKDLFSDYIVEKMELALQWRSEFLLPLFIPRDSMSISRLVFVILWLPALYIIFKKYENKIDTLTRGSLSFFGKNSLFIFCLHAVILFIISMVIGSQLKINMVLNCFIDSVLIAIVFGVAYYWKLRFGSSKKSAKGGSV